MSRGILVTGGSRGIGAAIVRRFAGLGDRVAVNYAMGQEAAEALIRDLPGTGHLPVQGDLRDAAQVEAMVEQAAAARTALVAPVRPVGPSQVRPSPASPRRRSRLAPTVPSLQARRPLAVMARS